MKKRRPYPTDASDEEWYFAAPYLTLMSKDAPQRHVLPARQTALNTTPDTPPRPEVHTDRIAAYVVDLMLSWAVVASCAYWLVLLLRLPAKAWFPVCAAFTIAALLLLRPRKFIWYFSCRGRWTYFLLTLCLATAAVSTFTNRPDSDDIAFSHRAVQAAMDLDRPFALGDTAHDQSGLPPLTPLHVFTSVEVTTALVARALHISQILAIHQGLGTIANLILPLVYFLLLRFCRIPTSRASLGTLAVLITFLMSGNAHRDWGNFTLLRSWQGKCILVALMVPLGMLFSLRFVQFGRRRDFLRLHAANIAGIGLSGTGLFLMPFVIGVASIGAWLAMGAPRNPGKRMCLVASVLVFPALVAILPWTGLLPRIGDISFYQSGGWPTAYLDNLALVFDRRSLILDIALLGTVIVLGRRNSQIKGLLIYLFLCALLITTPGARDLLLRIVTPGAYWRLAYAFVVPLWAGLATAALCRWAAQREGRRVMATVVAILLIGGTGWAKVPALNRAVLAKPGLKFPQQDLLAAQQIAATTQHGAVVLADYRVVTALGLLRPDLRFIVTRPVDTEMIFSNANRKTEGALRAAVGMALATCDFSKIESIKVAKTWPRLQEIVTSTRCTQESVRQGLGLTDAWHEAYFSGYRKWTRDTPVMHPA
jgi:hypothetical protein